MPTNSMLSIRPDYELATRYGAAWQTQILDSISLPYTDLYGNEATSANFFSELTTLDPLIVNIFGHGDYNIIACQNDELLLQGCVNDDALAGRIVFDLSCRAGRDLGASSIGKGAINFLGYTEDFIFAVTEGMHPDGGMLDPLQDEAARGFFESHNAAPITFIQGGSIDDAYFTSQDTFNYWIDYWEARDSQVAGFLVWDRDHQILHPAPVGPGIFPALLMFAPLLIIPLIRKK